MEMDEMEKVFADGLRKAASGRPALPVDVEEVIARGEAAGRAPVRRPSWRWLAVAAAVLLVAGVGVAYLNRPATVPAVPVGSPSAALVLTGTRWLATEIGGEPVEENAGEWRGEKVPWLEFDATTVSGGDPCNGVGADYRLDGDRLSFSNWGAHTDMGCNTDQQQRFEQALVDTTRVQRDGDELVFLDDAGTVVLRFRSASVSPVPSSDAVRIRVANGGQTELASYRVELNDVVVTGTNLGAGGISDFQTIRRMSGAQPKVWVTLTDGSTLKYIVKTYRYRIGVGDHLLTITVQPDQKGISIRLVSPSTEPEESTPTAAPASDLELTGVKWQATEIWGKSVQADAKGRVPWLRFSYDGTDYLVNGAEPCTQLLGNYYLDRNSLQLTGWDYGDGMSCVGTQGARFLAALDNVVTARLSGTKLELIDYTGRVAVAFEADPSTSPAPTASPTPVPIPDRKQPTPAAVKAQDGVSVRFRNISDVDFDNMAAVVDTESSRYVGFGLKAGKAWGYQAASAAFPDAFVSVDAGGTEYFHWPEFAGLSQLGRGKYTFEVDIVDGELKVTLVKDR